MPDSVRNWNVLRKSKSKRIVVVQVLQTRRHKDRQCRAVKRNDFIAQALIEQTNPISPHCVSALSSLHCALVSVRIAALFWHRGRIIAIS